MKISVAQTNTEPPCRQKIIRPLNNPFDRLPDDLLIAIFMALSSSVSSSSDLPNSMLVCRRFYGATLHPWVLKKANPKAINTTLSQWSEQAHNFLKLCVDAGNVEATYVLGMITFYCTGDRTKGLSMLTKAAMESHVEALHSLGVIEFNGSGKTNMEKDLTKGAALCARAASMGHINAMRDLGHCFQDGYGVSRNLTQGRKLLFQANALEAAMAGAICKVGSHKRVCLGKRKRGRQQSVVTWRYMLSEFGCALPATNVHPVRKFMAKWFCQNPPKHGMHMCSYEECGRVETRVHEFRRCSSCGMANYCSRSCQALHWRSVHRYNCAPSHSFRLRRYRNLRLHVLAH